MFMAIDEDHVRIMRSKDDVEGMDRLTGENAKYVMESAWAAKQDNPDTHGYIYKVLKQTGKMLKIRRANAYADSLIFAGTFAPMLVASGGGVDERDVLEDMVQAELDNEAWDLLYKS
jgi:hypothetical protein